MWAKTQQGKDCLISTLHPTLAAVVNRVDKEGVSVYEWKVILDGQLDPFEVGTAANPNVAKQLAEVSIARAGIKR